MVNQNGKEKGGTMNVKVQVQLETEQNRREMRKWAEQNEQEKKKKASEGSQKPKENCANKKKGTGAKRIMEKVNPNKK